MKVKGKWCYLYRAIDTDGNLVDSRLSEKRDMEAAQQFFKQALAVVGHTPEQVTTDGHASYPRAVREIMEIRGSIGPTNTSIIVWNKIIEGSSNAIIQCMVLGTSPQHLASALPSTNYAAICVLATPSGKQCHLQNNDSFSVKDLRPCNYS